MNALNDDLITEALRQVIDPEVGLNIVDMGLIYGIEMNDGAVTIRMTLTTQGCPMSAYMDQEVKGVLGGLEGIRDVQVDLVWDPPWSPDRIKPEALEALRSGNPY